MKIGEYECQMMNELRILFSIASYSLLERQVNTVRFRSATDS